MRVTSFFTFLLLTILGSNLLANGTQVSYRKVPIFRGEHVTPAIMLNIPSFESKTLRSISLDLKGTTSLKDVESIIFYSTGSQSIFKDTVRIAVASKVSTNLQVNTSHVLNAGDNYLWAVVKLSSKAQLTNKVVLKVRKLAFSKGEYLDLNDSYRGEYRLASVLRKAGQDGIHTYRIPGLATTNNGTLIAVYDNRYKGSYDLQGDIDVGMSRSTDGGETWEPMKPIIDMGEWGGLPKDQNGAGDPAVLVDKTNNHIWVAACWSHGHPDQRSWFASKPGIAPSVTSQFVLVKSEDDGKSWSEPINITPTLKDSSWSLFFNGPGAGISLKNGTIVFAAQFKKDIGAKAIDGSTFTPFSTIVYSPDHGKTWKVGSGAKSNTTEAQVVELNDGSLMLNMRDDRNRREKGDANGRAIVTTSDMGETWTTHSTSNRALQESNCMASLVRVEAMVNGKMESILFFSNPDSKTSRNNMTIKASLDGGLTWPKEFQILYDEDDCFGYSCISQVDAETIGVLYEGASDLFFQKIKISDFFSEKK